MNAGLGDAVNQVDQPVIINTAVLAQADLTSATGGDPLAAILHRLLEAAQ